MRQIDLHKYRRDIQGREASIAKARGFDPHMTLQNVMIVEGQEKDDESEDEDSE
jgi:hypothetical protein